MKTKFTLVELLITIAIIAILAAMLLPALNKAREKAKQINCMSYQKQMALAVINYADDNKEFVFPGYSINYPNQFRNTPWSKNYFSVLITGKYLKSKYSASVGFDFGPLNCPAAGFKNTCQTSYVWMIGFPNRPASLLRFPANSQQKYMFGDVTGSLIQVFDQTPSSISDNHKQGVSNWARTDGSVEEVKKTTMLLSSKVGQLFCIPQGGSL